MNVEYERCGSLHLITDEEKDKKLSRTVENWAWHEDHMRIIDAQEASMLCGVEIDKKVLYLPNSARINPAKLCAAYADGIEVRREVVKDAIILANGVAAKDPLDWLPIHTVRGQISYVKANETSKNLKTNLCYGGYISAPMNGIHAVGSTFQKWLTHTDILEEDHQAIMENLAQNVPAIGSFEIAGGRAALRTASQDRFPVVGAADDVFVSTAHGSHGIASSLASAHLLADFLRGGVRSFGKSTVNALDPSRFAERAARKKA